MVKPSKIIILIRGMSAPGHVPSGLGLAACSFGPLDVAHHEILLLSESLAGLHELWLRELFQVPVPVLWVVAMAEKICRRRRSRASSAPAAAAAGALPSGWLASMPPRGSRDRCIGMLVPAVTSLIMTQLS